MWRSLLTAALLLAVLICACTQEQATDKLRVTCSIFPLADIVRNIGREHVDVQVLIPAGASPHTFEPSPREFRDFAETKLLVVVGAGFEFWAERLVTATSPESLLIVEAAEGVDLIENITSHDLGDHEHAGEHGNPHVWLDPIIVRALVFRIAGSLSDIDITNAAEYLENANQFVRSLDSLDQEIRQTVSGFRTKEYVAFHPAWSYFARQYGLSEVGIIEESPGREPTPKTLRRIVEDIRRYEIRAVFGEPQLSPKAASALAGEAGVELLMLDPVGGGGLEGRDSYLKLMRYNLAIMRKAMG